MDKLVKQTGLFLKHLYHKISDCAATFYPVVCSCGLFLVLGLEYIHRLTTSHLYEMRVELTSYRDETTFVTFDHMMLLNEEQDYAINVGIKTAGTAGIGYFFIIGFSDIFMHLEMSSCVFQQEFNCDFTTLNYLARTWMQKVIFHYAFACILLVLVYW